MEKLVAVTIRFNGAVRTIFTTGYVGNDGKTRVPPSLINAELNKLGCLVRGQTYSIG